MDVHVFRTRLLLRILTFLLLFSFSVNAQQLKNVAQKRFTVLGLGDSITEGGETFKTYLFPLWERLFSAGYSFDFIGPKASKCRIGTLNNSGFGGKNAEFLEQHIDSIYRKYPADIVLLHAGHNHFIEEKPVSGIVNAQKSIIKKILAIRPDARILVATVINSGKLPKYSYIPELNDSLVKMVRSLHNKNVIMVNVDHGFDWQKHTIADKVHPNAAGADVMAENWFQSLKKILGTPEYTFHPEIIPYKQSDSVCLSLHVFKSGNLKVGDKRPAIIYFFGGGWTLGTPLQFYRECARYASMGMVAVSAEYRIAYVHKTTPFDSYQDAKDAIRWLRKNASRLNIDPDKIVAAGASAGGQLAAATGILKDTAAPADISSKPNLLMLYYPVVDNSPSGYGTDEMKKRFMEISPMHNINAASPSTLFILGTNDNLIPVETAKEFANRMKEAGVNCELHLIEGAGHPIFYYAKELTDNYYKIQELSDNFLRRYQYLPKY